MTRINFSRQVLPVVAVLAIVVAAALIWRTQPDRALAQPAQTPPSAPANSGAVVSGAGVIEPASELIAIGAEVPGVIDRMYVTVGQRVAAGELLFSVDSREARAAIAEATARRERLRKSAAAARTTLSVARRQYALYAEAGDPRAVSRQEVITRQGVLEDATAQLAVAEAQVREAESELATARVMLARHQVRAPRTAAVLQVRARAGEYAPAGQGTSSRDPLLTLGVVDPLHVRIDVDENEIGRLRIGRPATISPRGAAAKRVQVSFVRVEPLVVPKRSLTNAATERVDIRVMQLIYALPGAGASQGGPGADFFVGQQVDGFIPAAVAR